MLPDEAPGGLCPACVMLAAAEPETPVTAPSVEEIQRAFPHLEILECIGRGGMGIVYKAFQPHLGRQVALKLLDPGLHADPDFAERFAREARFLGRLAHPNIVGVHDFGETAGYFWLMMEYVDGVNLRQAMRAGRFSPEQALAIIPEICTALQFAHDQGVLHRDIKPENILLDAQGHVKIADFGIARLLDGESDFALTQTGAALGSAAYIAPEQIETPHDVDHRADIYSLGVVFYEMLTGELPLGRFPAPSEKSASDPGLDEVVFRALEKQREKRYQSADEVKSRVTGFGQSSRSGKAGPKPSLGRGLPWSVKLPLILFFAGIVSLVAFTLSADPFIAQFYWRKLWDPISDGRTSLELGSALYKQFLNLWFGSGLVLLGSGAGLGLWRLYQIKRGRLPAAGWHHLRRFILWPCLLVIPISILWLIGKGGPPILTHGQIQYAQWATFGFSLLISGFLFWISPRQAGIGGPSEKPRLILAGISVLLMFSASFVTKRLNDHWTDDLFPFELGWNVAKLDKAERVGLADAIARTAASFPAEVIHNPESGELGVRFILREQRFYKVYQNAFLLRLRATAPEGTWSMGGYETPIWWDAKVAMRAPTLFVLVASSLAAILAAWCGLVLARVSIATGVFIAGIFAILPSWPVPEAVAKMTLNGPPPAPTRPFVPVFSETTLAVQSVFDAAYLGDGQAVREGLSERLLATLALPGKFEAAVALLGKQRWVTNSSGDEKVWHLRSSDPVDFSKAYPIRIVKENGQWKLDELPES